MAEERALRKNQYMNKWAVFTLDPRWPWPLQMVAIDGWMLPHMCPCDMEAFLSCAPRIVGQGGCLNVRALLHIWAAAILKWPNAVHIWASMVADGMPGVSAGSPDSIATGYAEMSVELARQCDSDDMAWMHEQITTGSQQVLFGLAVWLSKSGMNSCAPPCKRQKQGQAATGELEVALGRAQKTYRVVVDNAVWKELLAVAAKFDATHAGGLPLPQNLQEARNFVSVVQEFLGDFPPSFGYGLAAGRVEKTRIKCKQTAPKTQNAGYCRKSIVRKIVLWAQSCSPECAWQGWTADILA